MMNKKGAIQAWALISIFLVIILLFMYFNGLFVGQSLKNSLNLIPSWFWIVIGLIIFIKLLGGKK